MPIMASRPFLISERRFSASCWEVSFLVKPGVSQTAGAHRHGKFKHTPVVANVRRQWGDAVCTSSLMSGACLSCSTPVVLGPGND